VGARCGAHAPVPQSSTGEDGGALLAHSLVTAGVVAVHMRVDHEFNWRLGDLPDGGHNLVVQRGELGVHHEHAIGADQQANCAALTIERVEVVADLVGLDLNVPEILLRIRTHGHHGEHGPNPN